MQNALTHVQDTHDTVNAKWIDTPVPKKSQAGVEHDLDQDHNPHVHTRSPAVHYSRGFDTHNSVIFSL